MVARTAEEERLRWCARLRRSAQQRAVAARLGCGGGRRHGDVARLRRATSGSAAVATAEEGNLQ
jgi:hypothetical protein